MGLWNSNNLAVRLTKLVGGLVVTAAVLMLWPTIVFSFPQKHSSPNATALVQSCEDTGPITRRGFGHNWDCSIKVRDDETGKTWTANVDMNFFTPDDVGKEKRLTWGYGGGRYNNNTELRTYTPAEGYSTGVFTLIGCLAGVVIVPAALWMLAKSIIWSFSREEQRKFWEKINGTTEEKSAKKQQQAEEKAQRQQARQRSAEIKEARRRAKEQRKAGR